LALLPSNGFVGRFNLSLSRAGIPALFDCVLMSYLYAGNCYSSAEGVYRAMAASCPPVTASGDPLVCTATATGYTVQVGNNSAIQVSPSLTPCVPELSDASELAGLVVAALASVYAFRLIWRAL
jgi:hypothetical protein